MIGLTSSRVLLHTGHGNSLHTCGSGSVKTFGDGIQYFASAQWSCMFEYWRLGRRLARFVLTKSANNSCRAILKLSNRADHVNPGRQFIPKYALKRVTS
jgi:hypothetical protein